MADPVGFLGARGEGAVPHGQAGDELGEVIGGRRRVEQRGGAGEEEGEQEYWIFMVWLVAEVIGRRAALRGVAIMSEDSLGCQR